MQSICRNLRMFLLSLLYRGLFALRGKRPRQIQIPPDHSMSAPDRFLRNPRILSFLSYCLSCYIPIFQSPFSINTSIVWRLALLSAFEWDRRLSLAYSESVTIFLCSKYANRL